jgi:hypothetical protein
MKPRVCRGFFLARAMSMFYIDIYGDVYFDVTRIDENLWLRARQGAG